MATDPQLTSDLHSLVSTVASNYIKNSPLYAFVLTSAKLESTSKGRITASIKVAEQHVNSKGILHGSVTATIVDWAGSLAVASCASTLEALPATGVSVDIHIRYVGGAVLNDTLFVEGTAEKHGGTLRFTSVRIEKVIRGEENKLVAIGSHTKFVK